MGYTDVTFLEKIKPYVLNDAKNTGILPSLTAAQAFIESNKGNSGLTTKANNLFGIKGTYNGQSVIMKTTEYYNGIPVKIDAAFRKYPSWAESIADHSDLFLRLKRYANLRKETNYVKACQNVQKDGYATAPDYASTLINTINKYKLYEWDAEYLGKPIAQSTVVINKPVLKKGARNAYVTAWQTYLNLCGYNCGKEDGVFGENMRLAVIDFQKSKGLNPDGIIGPKTWDAITA